MTDEEFTLLTKTPPEEHQEGDTYECGECGEAMNKPYKRCPNCGESLQW